MVASIGGVAQSITIKHGKTYSSIWYDSVLAFRLKLRDAARYIEVPVESKGTVADIAPLDGQKDVSGGFWRVNLGEKPVSDCAGSLMIADLMRLRTDSSCFARNLTACFE